mgnify:FL=1
MKQELCENCDKPLVITTIGGEDYGYCSKCKEYFALCESVEKLTSRRWTDREYEDYQKAGG